MNIDTEVCAATVEIEGGRYPVAPKTVEVAEKLSAAAKEARGRERYWLWLKRLKILLGKDAVARLFPKGKNENLDRMEIIYLGVMDAFDMAARRQREERNARVARSVKEMAESLAPFKELLQSVDGLISRDDKLREE